MRHLPNIVVVTVLMISLANTQVKAVEPIRTDALTQTVTKSVRAHANVRIRRIPKFNVLRSNPHRLSMIFGDPDDDALVDDDGLMSPYRRRDFGKVEHPDGISPHVRWRLFLARQLALIKYKEIWADKA